MLVLYAGRGPLTTLLMAELDSLVDEMSYEELYDVFGGEPTGTWLLLSRVTGRRAGVNSWKMSANES